MPNTFGSLGMLANERQDRILRDAEAWRRQHRDDPNRASGALRGVVGRWLRALLHRPLPRSVPDIAGRLPAHSDHPIRTA